MATVREYMDPDPATVTPDTSAEDVARLLGEQELHGVPVVDGDGRVVGIATENDLVLSDEEGDLHIPHYIELFGGLIFLEPLREFRSRLRKATATSAADLMTANPTTIGPGADLHEAGRIISGSGHNRLPVVGEDGRLVGVITRADVLRGLTSE
jgi:CBS domain-containing protein